MPSKLNSVAGVWTPTLAASFANLAASLPPQGAQFAPWDGPAALIFVIDRAARVAPRAHCRRRQRLARWPHTAAAESDRHATAWRQRARESPRTCDSTR